MNNSQHNRQDKISLLKDILNGKRKVADLHRHGKTIVKMWNQVEKSVWKDEEGNIKKEDEIEGDDFYEAMTYGGVVNVFIYDGTDEIDERNAIVFK